MQAQYIETGMTIGIPNGEKLGQRILVNQIIVANEDNLGELEEFSLNGHGAVQVGSILLIGVNEERRSLAIVFNPMDEVNVFSVQRAVVPIISGFS